MSGLASNIDLNGVMEQPIPHTGSFKLTPQVDIEISEPVKKDSEPVKQPVVEEPKEKRFRVR